MKPLKLEVNIWCSACSEREGRSPHANQPYHHHHQASFTHQKHRGAWRNLRMGNSTCNYLKCLTVKFCAWKNERPARFLAFQVSCISKRAQMTSKHSFWVLWNFISSTTFYAKHCGLSQPVAQCWLWFSGTHRINSTPHSLWGELKASLSPMGFGWVWLNSAVVVSSWARKWHYVLRKTTINCQGQ